MFSEYNAKFYGFKTIQDFYDASSIDSKVEHIKLPTIFLNAADDMLSPSRGKIAQTKNAFFFQLDFNWIFFLSI
jgi:predicted alpha/beta-fold hydrolase